MAKRTAWPLVSLEMEYEHTVQPLVNSLLIRNSKNIFSDLIACDNEAYGATAS